MKKILFLAALTAFVSCQKENKASDKIDAKKSDSVTAAVASSYEAQLKSMAAPAQINPMANTTTVQPNTNASTASVPATKPGMNPPHRQPGHRCDIAVGAPLNSKPAAPSNTQSIKMTPAPATTNGQVQNITAPSSVPSLLQPNTEAPKAVPQKTLEGWQGKANPAHGQEGHRCDVKVGDPLP
ncbi:hypothetical protein [Flavobacterium sp.]|uniref:hypothetical protein n=1 Tax=Flavobacterium sp. TaxID=239 RepID=UPI0028BEC109|nr:hypothetical protein [Flavobacterium sp.]